MHFYRQIQGAIEDVICSKRGRILLPQLSYTGFLNILNLNNHLSYSAVAAENDRLEFLGDSVMHSSLGRLIHELVPRGSPYLYTACCSALWSNLTFCRLSEASDILSSLPADVSYELERYSFGSDRHPLRDRSDVKRTADLFESILGAYYQEAGSKAFDEWVEFTFTPLIHAAASTFYKQYDLSKARKQYTPTHYGSSSRGSRSHPTPRRSVYSPNPVSRKTRHPTLDTASVSRWLHQVEKVRDIQPKQLARKQSIASSSGLLQSRSVELVPNAATRAAMKLSLASNKPSASSKSSGTPLKPASTSSKPTPIGFTSLPSPPATPTNADPDTTLVNDSLVDSPLEKVKVIIDLTQDEDKPITYSINPQKRRSTAPSPEPRIAPKGKATVVSLTASLSASTLSDMQISDAETDSEGEVENALFATGKAGGSHLRPPAAFVLLPRRPSPCL